MGNFGYSRASPLPQSVGSFESKGAHFITLWERASPRLGPIDEDLWNSVENLVRSPAGQAPTVRAISDYEEKPQTNNI